MIEVISDLSVRPQIRPDIRFGPPLVGYGKTIHYVKDPQTHWFYQIGEKEYFLLSRMDGEHTLEELSQEYETIFGRRLDERAWLNLFKLINSRQLLFSENNRQLVEQRKEEALKRKRAARKGILRYRFSLANPDRFLETLYPWLRFIFKPAFFFSSLAVILLIEISFLWQIGPLLNAVKIVRSSSQRDNIVLLILFVLIMWFSIGIHEIAHGLTCKHFGGSVQEMGVTWRYLMFFPYCQVDDIVLFSKKRHRVATAFAGSYTSFLLLIPFALLWFLPVTDTVHMLSALVLVFLNVSAVANFIPFVEMDGYFMLNHALGFLELRHQAHNYCMQLIKMLPGRQRPASSYDRRSAAIYIGYGICSLTFTILFIGYTCIRWFTLLLTWLGPSLFWVLFPLLAIVLPLHGLAALGIIKPRRRKIR